MFPMFPMFPVFFSDRKKKAPMRRSFKKGKAIDMATTKDPIATALRETFISPNVADSNFEAANLVDVADNLARALWRLARIDDPDESRGAVELLSKEIKAGSERIAGAMQSIAEAIRERSE